MDCKLCCYKHNPDSIDLNLLRNVLQQAKKLKYTNLGLTGGGEVCLHPEFSKLIEICVEESFDFTISSNGYEFEKYILLLEKYEKNFKSIIFSLDSTKRKLQDKLRIKGSYDQVIKAIKHFNNKIYTSVSFCLNKYNKNQIKGFIALSTNLNIKTIRFLSVIPTGRNDEYVLSDKEKQECINEIYSYQKESKINIKIQSSLFASEGIGFCVALDLRGITLTPDGRLLICCDAPGSDLGSLKAHSLEELLEKGHQESYKLKRVRKYHLYTNSTFEGFNTCIFCNKYLGK